MDEAVAESVVDRLLLALAAQLDASGDRALAADAVEAFTGLSRTETQTIFRQAGHLVHYGVDTKPLETLIDVISAVQRREAPGDVTVRPGDAVRLVGAVPESLAGYDEAWVRGTVFVVRYLGTNATVDVQSDLVENYVVATVPAAAVEPVRR